MTDVASAESRPRRKAAPPARTKEAMKQRLSGGEVAVLLGTLAVLVLVNAPELGSQPWRFRPTDVDPTGVLAPLVRAADDEWDVDVVRAPAVVAGLVVAFAAAASFRLRTWRLSAAVALAFVVLGLLLVPAVLLQVGLRQATEPWYYTNDSTYQIELGGELVLNAENPYGHDYSASGLERFYPAVGARAEEQVALEHFAYFPGTPLTAAVWRLLPEPLDDYRFFVLLTTLAAFFAVLLFRAPLGWRLAAGAAVAANPLAVRAAWFGTADAPSLLLLVLAFALLARARLVAAAAALGAAVLLKQFALIAVPFFAVLLVARRVPRQLLARAVAVFGAIVVAGVLPFLIADAGAFWDDTVAYGAETYRIIGYGLAGLLVRAGVIENRFDPYPFLLVTLLVWVPVTIWLLANVLRLRTLSAAAAGFSISIFVLFFVSRVFQNSYLVWPLVGLVLAFLLAAAERAGPRGAKA